MDRRSEEDLAHLEAKSDSFWDIGNYQRVIKRIENGAKTCGELTKMIQERADIEAKYSRGLQQWSKKWEELVSKGPEYGSMAAGWRACLNEANQVAAVHAEVCSKVQHNIISEVQTWRSNNFQKYILGVKEAKKAEESFVHAQKPWLKRLQKNNRAKKAYFKSANDVETLSAKLRMAETSSDITPEQCAKTRDKWEQATNLFDKTLEKYKQRLQEVQHYQPRYIEDTTILFDKCQDAERARTEFFGETFQKLKQALDIYTSQSLAPIYSEYENTLSQLTPDEDLRWYAQHQGTGMSYHWPEFEPYISGQVNYKSSLKHSTIRGEAKSGPSRKSSSVCSQANSKPSLQTSPKKIISPSDSLSVPKSRSSDAHAYQGSLEETSSAHSIATNSSSIDQQPSVYSSDDDEWLNPPPPSIERNDPQLHKTTVELGVDNEIPSLLGHAFHPTCSHPQNSTDAPKGSRSDSEENEGFLMRALYDYLGSEKDDLCFTEGDVLRVMHEGEDGWAEAKMGDKYGYVPISYLEPVCLLAKPDSEAV